MQIVLRPDVYTTLMWIAGYLIPAIVVLRTGDAPYVAASGLSLRLEESEVIRSLWISAILPLSVIVAGLFSRRVRPAAIHEVVDARRLRLVTKIAIGISTGAVLILLAIIGPTRLVTSLNNRILLFEGLNYFLLLAALCTGLTPTIIFLLTMSGGNRRLRWSEKLLMVVLVFTAGAGAVLAGQKTTFAIPIMYWILLLISANRLSGSKLLFWSVSFAGLYFFWDKILREYLVLGHFVDYTVNFGSFLENAYLNTFPSFEVFLLSRQLFFHATDFVHGETYRATLVAWIPRRLWAAKPLSPAGQFGLVAYPNLSAGSTIPPGLLGEAWMNFGLAGIIIVSIVIAIWLWRDYGKWRSTNQYWPRVRYLLILASFFGFIRGESLGSLVSLVAVLVPNWMLITAAVRRRVPIRPLR